MKFPEVPLHLRHREHSGSIEPAKGMDEWVQAMFMDPESKFYNIEHQHLDGAHVGYVWTNVANHKNGKRIIGTAQVGEPQGGTPWAKIRQYEQLERWFGIVPDFLITLDAVFLWQAEPAAICALVEHELYHCAQKRNQYGEPVFTRDGDPVWAMRPHDVEEFIGVARRYGAWDKGLRDMREALTEPPIFGAVELDGVCGLCA